MTLTSEDTAGVRHGRMDTLATQVDFYLRSFTPDEIVALAPLSGPRILEWMEIDQAERIIRTALTRAVTGGRA